MDSKCTFSYVMENLTPKKLSETGFPGSLAKDENGILHVFVDNKWIEFEEARKMIPTCTEQINT